MTTKLGYSKIVENFKNLKDIMKLKNVKTHPIFSIIIKKVNSDMDYGVKIIKTHPYLRSKLLIAYRNNLVVIYNFIK